MPVEDRTLIDISDDQPSAGKVLWGRVGRRVRNHVRVVGAFRTAGQMARLRQRTSRLPAHAIGGPDARAPRRASEANGVSSPSPAEAMWRTAIARVQYQLRVVRAFQGRVVKRQGSVTQASAPSQTYR